MRYTSANGSTTLPPPLLCMTPLGKKLFDAADAIFIASSIVRISDCSVWEVPDTRSSGGSSAVQPVSKLMTIKFKISFFMVCKKVDWSSFCKYRNVKSKKLILKVKKG